VPRPGTKPVCALSMLFLIASSSLSFRTNSMAFLIAEMAVIGLIWDNYCGSLLTLFI